MNWYSGLDTSSSFVDTEDNVDGLEARARMLRGGDGGWGSADGV